MRRRKLLLGAVLGAVLATAAGVGVAVANQSGDRSLEVAAQAKASHGKAKYVIFLLGDGMGQSEITIARNYQYGAAGRLPGIDTPPLTGDITTYALQEADPSKPEYVTDSAASGTGWATGHKTSNGRISTTAKTDLTLPTIFEQVAKKGWATGNVSTAEITDATPAVLASHVNARGCQGPADMAACPKYKKSAGGPGSIAEQEVDHKSDVILGGGKGRFDQVIDGGPYAGKTVVDQAKALGYTVVTDAAGLDAVKKGPVLGLFNKGNMSLEWKGLPADKPVTGPQVCQENQRPANEPSLAAMTQKAIDLLLAKNSEALLPPGRGRLDRQAGPRGGSVRADRRDDRLRQRDPGRPRVREDASEDAHRRHRRPLPLEPDRRARLGDPGPRLDPHHQGGRADGDQLRHGPEGRLAEPHRRAAPRRRAGSAVGQRGRPARPDRAVPPARARDRRRVAITPIPSAPTL